MPLKKIDYKDARKLMQAGDVIAFGGNSFFSEVIKLTTHSLISHVGVILQTEIRHDTEDRFINKIIESASINGFSGVQDSRLSERLEHYNGDEIWWLPLKKEIREQRFDQTKFYNFLFAQAEARKEYDLPQGIKSAIDGFDKIHGPSYNKEDYSKFFCSELVAAGFEYANVTDSINASEVTAIDLCRWNIYEDNYYQLKGDLKEISKFNSLSPSDWNI